MSKQKNIFLNSKNFLLSFTLFVIVSGLIFLGSFFIIKSRIHNFSQKKNRYHIVLNHRFGHVDKGFSEQAVSGLCSSFKVKPKDCNASNSLFKEAVISYGFPFTMDDPFLMNSYIKNFVKNDNANNFILPGYTYTEFLCKFNADYEKQKVNMIAIGTYFGFFFHTKAKKCKFVDQNKWPTNLWEVNFKEYYAGYHAGLYSGAYALQNPDQFKDYSTDKEGKQIAFASVGGLWLPAIMSYSLGFKYGIQKINEARKEFTDKQTEVLFVNYKTIGGFDFAQFADKTKEISKKLFMEEKISVIFSIAVTLTSSVHVAALESNKAENKKQNWVVGVDVDQGYSILEEPKDKPEIKESILISAVIQISKVVKKIIKDKIEKNIKPTKAYIPGEDGAPGENHGQYSTIPNRFQKTKIWKKIKKLKLIDDLFKNNMNKTFDCVIQNVSGDQEKKANGFDALFKKFLKSDSSSVGNNDLWNKLIKGCDNG